jgi:protein-S-isoprenylcysteine O-methyltransferase Ste14
MSAIDPPAHQTGSHLPDALRRGTKSYDLWAAVPLMIWYGLGATAQIGALHKDFAALNFTQPQFALITDILSRLATMLFAVVIIGLLFARKPASATASGIGPRVAGVLGTYLSVGLLLLPPAHIAWWLRDIATAMILGGMAFALYALLWLGRSVSLVAEARKLVTGGPYSVVRHPLYLGEGIAILGVVLQYLSVWALLILGLQLICQLYRMSCEEQVLGNTFPDYDAYKSRTFRLVPGVY